MAKLLKQKTVKLLTIAGVILLATCYFLSFIPSIVNLTINTQYMDKSVEDETSVNLESTPYMDKAVEIKASRISEQMSSEWTPYMDVLDDSVLRDPPLTDLKDMSSANNSLIYIIGRNKRYTVGDEIRINIQMFNGHGNRRVVGGDKLCVRIFEDSLGAAAAGYVLDHNNGTYTAVVKCLWSGRPSLLVYIEENREALGLMYRHFEKNNCAKESGVKYTNGEMQTCLAFKHWFNTSTDVCNMTDRNGGMSWYCKAPDSKNITCNDVYRFEPGTGDSIQYRLATTPLAISVLRKDRDYFPALRVEVKERTGSAKDQPVKPPCISYNKTALWFLPSPVGYLFKNNWITDHCRSPSPNKFRDSLRNTHIVFYGDSTIGQWTRNINQKCILPENKTENTKYTAGWKLDFAFDCKLLNINITWTRHSLPGNVFRDSSKSVAKDIFTYQHKKNIVFVIHLFAHLVRFHQSVFRDRMRQIRNAIEAFLRINDSATFFFKGGNTYKTAGIFRYYYYIYRLIVIEEFKGLYDKIIYLDQQDAAVAIEQRGVHDGAVEEMVKQMFAYMTV